MQMQQGGVQQGVQYSNNVAGMQQQQGQNNIQQQQQQQQYQQGVVHQQQFAVAAGHPTMVRNSNAFESPATIYSYKVPQENWLT